MAVEPGSGARSEQWAPPHNLEAEASVLGAVLLSDKILDPLLIDVGLKTDDFYRQRHRLIYQAMLKLKESSEPVDPLTVTAALRESGEIEEAGGSDYVHTLVEAVPAIGNARHYGQIVKENAMMRRLLRASQEIQESIANHDGDPRQLIERAQQSVFEVAHEGHSGDFRPVGDVLHDELDKLEMLSRESTSLTGTPTGYRDLDDVTGGFQKGNLIIIAARPSMGKSALVTNIAENAALKGFPVALFSLEMSQTELAQRFVASQAKIDGDHLRKGKVKKDRWPAVLKASAELAESPLWIDDSSDINILELRAKARRLHGKALNQSNGEQGLGLIIVDYLQLLRADDSRDNRVEQVGQMSRGLKILARELDVPVIAVSQLSRAVESRTPAKPILSDLRECVTGETLVVLADGSRKPIADLVGEQADVIAIDSNDRVVVARCDKVWKVGRKEAFEVKLASGKSICATAKHRIRTDRGWQTVAELSTSDHVALSSHVPEPEVPFRTSYSGISDFEFARSSQTAVLSHTKLLEREELEHEHATTATATNDLDWDRVVEISPLGVREVFDLSVPGPECWLADGIVTHNSGQIEQDADLVMFIYREEYYLKNESERPGEADILVAKHRNGPLRDIALTFMNRYPKFANMPKSHYDATNAPASAMAPESAQGGPSDIGAADLDEF